MEAVNHLKVYDKVTLITYNDEAFDGVYKMVENIADINENENLFLIEIAPLIKNQISLSGLHDVEQQVLESAKCHGLKNDSFSVYAALSCIYSSQQTDQSASRVLNPGRIEKNGNAYNALADLSLLRLFVGTLALSESQNLPQFALLSADLNLRNFWMGLEVSDVNLNEEGVPTATFVFSEQMFPTLGGDERLELAKRVEGLS